jgi:hypothetical protein
VCIHFLSNLLVLKNNGEEVRDGKQGGVVHAGHDLRCMGMEEDAASNAESFSAAWLAYAGVLTGS